MLNRSTNDSRGMKREKKGTRENHEKNQQRGKKRADNSADFRNTQPERNERCARRGKSWDAYLPLWWRILPRKQ